MASYDAESISFDESRQGLKLHYLRAGGDLPMPANDEPVEAAPGSTASQAPAAAAAAAAAEEGAEGGEPKLSKNAQKKLSKGKEPKKEKDVNK